ncbi:sulfite exporter TauE/SafE family protein [Thalassotalea litorea]|uniref:Sulfite exporter TauE/SafE family protein n=1 Tax=Thalassotalea litorea TaxID=2020715 RepID=A0A5R9ILB9_9GAMM|nr:sulfite exporter TauE/SafE family protein [Thalassotalea litorea]TLU66335.1 sulfite exporter TauE/SafE family protein [Thalassotalea litorea]
MEMDVISAFIVGLAGAGHCIAMCGGITSMLTQSIGRDKPPATLIISYNLGRIFSYTIAGVIAGFTGSLAAKSIGLPIAVLQLIAAVFLILLGLYVGQWLFLLHRVEAMGKHLWRHIQPFSKRFLPVMSSAQALALGAIWGWLPCGLVYSTLTWSMASGDALQGGAIMLAFGLGTLPALFTLSVSFSWLTDQLRKHWVKKASGGFLLIYGIYSLNIALKNLF